MSHLAERRVPGPPPQPILGWWGSVFWLLRDPIQYLSALRRRYGDLVGLACGGHRGGMIAGPAYPATIFAFGPVHNARLFTDTDLFHATFPIVPLAPVGQRAGEEGHVETTLFFVNGKVHKQQRALVAPAFHQQHLETYLDAIGATTEEMLRNWAPGQCRYIDEEMLHLVTRIAGRTLLGLDDPHLEAQVSRAAVQWAHQLTHPLVGLPLPLPGLPYRRFLREHASLHRLLCQALTSGRAMQAPCALAALQQVHAGQDSAWSDEELVSYATVLFLPGLTATSITLTWTLFLLAQHPRICAEVYDELKGRLGGGRPTMQQLKDLTLLEWVLKESMRLLPPAPMGVRITTAEVEMGAYAVANQTKVIYSQYHTHHQPELYRAPGHFCPERWAGLRPTPYEYLPFGAGQRSCLGASFAFLEMKMVLAILLQRYGLEPVPKGNVDYQSTSFALNVRGHLPMIVRCLEHLAVRPVVPVGGTIHRLVDLLER